MIKSENQTLSSTVSSLKERLRFLPEGSMRFYLYSCIFHIGEIKWDV